MFWGITLDAGKRYTQTVEKSFHLSMAALGFNNTTADPVTIMVEVDKAQFALCTLQPGKIPQQTLDIAFTEGEEITFFTEGNNEVHLTGYLVEEPETIEIDENEDFSLDSDESASVSGSNESESDSNEEEEEEEDESSSEEVTLQHLLVGENVSDEDNQSDNDWDPAQDNPSAKVKSKRSQRHKKKEMQNAKMKEENVSNGTSVQQPGGLTAMLLNDSLPSSDDESDEYIPTKKKKDQEATKKLSPKKKGKKRKMKESNDTDIVSPEKAKRSKKRTSKVSGDS